MTDDETLLEALHRKERYRLMREEEEEKLAAVIGSDSAWAQFVKIEGERSKKLEPLRRAYLEAQKKKVNQDKGKK